MSDHEKEPEGITRPRKHVVTDRQREQLAKARAVRAANLKAAKEAKAAKKKPPPLDIDTRGYAEHVDVEVVEDEGAAAAALETPAPTSDDSALRAAITAALLQGLPKTQTAVKKAVEPARTYGMTVAEWREVIREEVSAALAAGKKEQTVTRVAGGRSRKVKVEESEPEESEASEEEASEEELELPPPRRASRRTGRSRVSRPVYDEGAAAYEDPGSPQIDWAASIIG